MSTSRDQGHKAVGEIYFPQKGLARNIHGVTRHVFDVQGSLKAIPRPYDGLQKYLKAINEFAVEGTSHGAQCDSKIARLYI